MNSNKFKKNNYQIKPKLNNKKLNLMTMNFHRMNPIKIIKKNKIKEKICLTLMKMKNYLLYQIKKKKKFQKILKKTLKKIKQNLNLVKIPPKEIKQIKNLKKPYLSKLLSPIIILL